MDIAVMEKNGIKYLTGIKGKKLIQAESDIGDVFGACYEKQADRVLLYKDNLPLDFVKLGSGQAGMVLNKFMTYKVKLAVIVDGADMNKGKFSEMVTEVNIHNNLFHVFADPAAAEEWLVKN